MNKKLLGIFVITLLIATAIPAMGFTEEHEKNILNSLKDESQTISYFEIQEVGSNVKIENPEVTTINIADQLDQYQTSWDYDYQIGKDGHGYMVAQSFIPTLPTLTKFSMYLSTSWDMYGHWSFGSYFFCIRQGSLTGSNILLGSISSSELSQGTSFWLTFYPSSPLSVSPGSTYYIVTYGASPLIWTGAELYWYYKSGGNAYLNGEGHVYDYGWWPIFGGADFCFKTYGESGGGNNPPNIPSTPSGPSAGDVGTSYTYSTSTTDNDGDQVQYQFDWDSSGSHDYSGWTPLDTSGHTDSLSHTWSAAGTYQVKAQARDEHGLEGGWSSALTVTISGGNNPPDKPDTPTGQTNGKTRTSYTYTTSTDDPEGDQVYYQWDWGDEVSTWDGPYNSGDPVTTSHTWSNQGTYAVKVKARDTSNAESVLSDPLSVTMPKNKLFINTFFLQFLENHPHMFPIIRTLLGL